MLTMHQLYTVQHSVQHFSVRQLECCHNTGVVGWGAMRSNTSARNPYILMAVCCAWTAIGAVVSLRAHIRFPRVMPCMCDCIPALRCACSLLL